MMTPLFALLPALLSPPSAAHGGFHESQSVGEVPTVGADPDVVTNYGLLSPVEGTDDWAWICEEVSSPEGFNSWLQIDGRWLLGGFEGMMWSDDLCDWPSVEGVMEGLYVTGLFADTQVEGRVWATTSSGEAENALWRSDDRGESWMAFATFGEGTTQRGMVQAPEGLPMWVMGWDDVQPRVWITTDGETWSGYDLPSDGIYSVDALGYSNGGAMVRIASSDSEALWRVEVDGSLDQLFSFEDEITAFDSGPGADELYVGGKELGLYYSADGGQTWAEPVTAPQPGCLETRGQERFICSHNWSDGGAVLRTPLQGGDPSSWKWEPVVWFGDVRQVQDCPDDSDTVRQCMDLWENASPEAGFNQDPAGDGGADSGGGDTGSPSTETGCCSGSEAGLLFLGPLLGLGALRRRRR